MKNIRIWRRLFNQIPKLKLWTQNGLKSVLKKESLKQKNLILLQKQSDLVKSLNTNWIHFQQEISNNYICLYKAFLHFHTFTLDFSFPSLSSISWISPSHFFHRPASGIPEWSRFLARKICVRISGWGYFILSIFFIFLGQSSKCSKCSKCSLMFSNVP